MVFSFLALSSNLNFLKHGWNRVNDKIGVVWEDSEIMGNVKGTKTCGCKGAKCDGSSTGCRNCYKMCKPCTLKCKCKAQCHNPHNNRRTCPRCAPSADTDHDSDDNSKDEQVQQAKEEVLPVVPPSHHDDFDSESGTDGLEDQNEHV